jgi:hypothetical protein
MRIGRPSTDVAGRMEWRQIELKKMTSLRGLRCDPERGFRSAPRPRRGPSSVFGRPGGISGEPVPDPIPNSAVKLPSANGTKSQDLEE